MGVVLIHTGSPTKRISCGKKFCKDKQYSKFPPRISRWKRSHVWHILKCAINGRGQFSSTIIKGLWKKVQYFAYICTWHTNSVSFTPDVFGTKTDNHQTLYKNNKLLFFIVLRYFVQTVIIWIAVTVHILRSQWPIHYIFFA